MGRGEASSSGPAWERRPVRAVMKIITIKKMFYLAFSSGDHIWKKQVFCHQEVLVVGLLSDQVGYLKIFFFLYRNAGQDIKSWLSLVLFLIRISYFNRFLIFSNFRLFI